MTTASLMFALFRVAGWASSRANTGRRGVAAGRGRQSATKTFLAAASADRLHAAWRLSLYWLRRSEVRGLRWADIDLPGQALTVSQSRVLVEYRVRIEVRICEMHRPPAAVGTSHAADKAFDLRECGALGLEPQPFDP